MSKGLRIFLICIGAYFTIVGAIALAGVVVHPQEARAIRSTDDERSPRVIRAEAKELINALLDHPESMKNKEVTLELILYSRYDPYLFSKISAEKSGSKERYFQGQPSAWWPSEGSINDQLYLFVPTSLEAPNLDSGSHAIVTFVFSGRLSQDNPSMVKAISRPASR